MELSVKEAAAFMGRSPRTVRAQLARGDLPGVKRDGRWLIDRKNLPLTETQRQALQAKADDVRATVEKVLPSRNARRSGDRSRSVADLDAFKLGAEVLALLRAAGPGQLDEATRQRACESLERSLLALAEAALHFDRQAKREAIDRCRASLASTVGLLRREPPRVAKGGGVTSPGFFSLSRIACRSCAMSWCPRPTPRSLAS